MNPNDTHTGIIRNGSEVILHNNPAAKPRSWNEIIEFVKNDDTNTRAYTDEWNCIEYAAQLHDRAESSGFKAGIVILDLMNPEKPDAKSAHMLNAFQSSDRGVVYVDNTVQDMAAEFSVGRPYYVRLIEAPDESSRWEFSPGNVVTGTRLILW